MRTSLLICIQKVLLIVMSSQMWPQEDVPGLEDGADG
jgi:hypothetical protein